MLQVLLSSCTECAGVTRFAKTCTKGAYVEFHILCDTCGSERTWSTTEKIRSTYIVNNILSGAILFCGGAASKVLRILQSAGIVAPSVNTYTWHQQTYLHGVSTVVNYLRLLQYLNLSILCMITILHIYTYIQMRRVRTLHSRQFAATCQIHIKNFSIYEVNKSFLLQTMLFEF